jgi:hypothetical protein
MYHVMGWVPTQQVKHADGRHSDPGNGKRAGHNLRGLAPNRHEASKMALDMVESKGATSATFEWED